MYSKPLAGEFLPIFGAPHTGACKMKTAATQISPKSNR
jgi:hypothetical protein